MAAVEAAVADEERAQSAAERGRPTSASVSAGAGLPAADRGMLAGPEPALAHVETEFLCLSE